MAGNHKMIQVLMRICATLWDEKRVIVDNRFCYISCYIYDGIQAISDGKIGWSKFLVKNHPGPLRIHILIGLDPKNCLKFSKKVNFMIFKNLVKSTKAKMAISEILPFSGKIVIAAKRKGLKRSPICQN